MAYQIEEIVLAGPRGFCAGVERAIEIVELALQVCERPVYVRKEIVHNRHVVEELRAGSSGILLREGMGWREVKWKAASGWVPVSVSGLLPPRR